MSHRSRVPYPVWPHTFISPSTDSRRAVVSYWQKYVHEVLVNCLVVSLPRKSVVRSADFHMTIDVYHGRKTTTTTTLLPLELEFKNNMKNYTVGFLHFIF